MPQTRISPNASQNYRVDYDPDFGTHSKTLATATSIAWSSDADEDTRRFALFYDASRIPEGVTVVKIRLEWPTWSSVTPSDETTQGGYIQVKTTNDVEYNATAANLWNGLGAGVLGCTVEYAQHTLDTTQVHEWELTEPFLSELQDAVIARDTSWGLGLICSGVSGIDHSATNSGMPTLVVDWFLGLTERATYSQRLTSNSTNYDTYLDSFLVNSNRDSFSTLSFGHSGSNPYRTLIRHTITGVPPNAIISNASLALKIQARTGTNTRTVQVNRIKEPPENSAPNWNRTQNCWNERATGFGWWGAAGCATADTDYASTPVHIQGWGTPSAGTTLTLSGSGLTALVQDAVSNRGGVLTIRIRTTVESGSTDFISPYSADTGVEADRPLLSFDYGSGATGLALPMMGVGP